MRELVEAAMSPLVSAWLEDQGYEVYAEVPTPGGASHIDLVGWVAAEDRIACVEMKRSLTQQVRRQAYLHQSHTSETYVAVGTNPTKKSLAHCEKLGIGVLRVNGDVSVLLQPQDRRMTTFFRERLKTYLNAMAPGGIGGLPNLRGQGPAQECYEQVQKYRERLPQATWKEMYENVPNHYVSANSMCGAMRMVEERRAFLERRRSNENLHRE